MRATTRALRESGTIAFRYAIAFGGVIALILLLANIDRTVGTATLPHHAVAFISR